MLGIDAFEWIGLRGGEWTDTQLLSALEAVMSRHRPHLVYAPSIVDFHPEHRGVAHALARFWQSARERPLCVRIYPVQVPLTPTLANLVVDVSPEMPRASDAMSAYTTQLANIPRAIRQRRYAARCYRAGTHAEEFWEMSVPEYVALHLDGQAQRRMHFRGIREQAVSDPLAYLVGQRARGWIAREARLRVSTS